MKALAATLKQLVEDTEPISVASLFVLSDLDRDDVNLVDRTWPTIPVDRRQAAMRHLVDIAEENFEVDFNSIYRIGLSDSDPEVRAAAIDGLWEDNDPDLIAPLLNFLQADSNEVVRSAAATALGQFVLSGEYEEIPADKIQPVIDALCASYTQAAESIEVRRRALESLAYHTFEELPGYIRSAYQDSNEQMRISAVQAMGRSADDQWMAIVINELGSPNPVMRFEAAQSAGELEIPQAVKHLVKLVDDVDDEVQKAAVWALGLIGGEVAQKTLAEVLESDNEYLHETAEDAIAELEFKSGNLDFKLLDFEDDEDDDEEWALDLEELEEDEEDDDLAQYN